MCYHSRKIKYNSKSRDFVPEATATGGKAGTVGTDVGEIDLEARDSKSTGDYSQALKPKGTCPAL